MKIRFKTSAASKEIDIKDILLIGTQAKNKNDNDLDGFEKEILTAIEKKTSENRMKYYIFIVSFKEKTHKINIYLINFETEIEADILGKSLITLIMTFQNLYEEIKELFLSKELQNGNDLEEKEIDFMLDILTEYFTLELNQTNIIHSFFKELPEFLKEAFHEKNPTMH